MHPHQQRIQYLDGLRGLAISLVVLFHMWGAVGAAALPIGGGFGWFAPIRVGWVGVELFFLISGYVILLTLERCANLREFLVRRWLRLFPAMLIASAGIFAFGLLTQSPVRPHLNGPIDLLPGLTFVDPTIWHAVLHTPLSSLDESFWSLYVEVVFYIVFGVTYFSIGWRGALLVLVALCTCTISARPILTLFNVSPHILRATEPMYWLGFDKFFWFAAGVCFARSREEASNPLFLFGILIGLVAAVTTHPQPRPILDEDRVAMGLALMLFASAERLQVVQTLLTWRPLLFIGAISYPLYLIHQKVGLGLSLLWGETIPSTKSVMLPLPGLIAVTATAALIAFWLEPLIKSALQGCLQCALVRAQRTKTTR